MIVLLHLFTMDSLTTFNDNGLIISDCHNTNIYMMIVISSLVFLLMINWIYFVCLKTKSNTKLEVKIDKIDKNILTLMKTFRELKKID
jgi:hypothetical protein